jgi:O-methyltransferase involved in polyketide biosynthesis
MGLIKLVGVDTEYEIYSGNFSIAKDKVKNFGKNRLISTILALRAKYFDEFFLNLSAEEKQKYSDAHEGEL